MNTKTALSVFSSLLFAAIGCFGQGTPDCQWTDTFVAAVAGASHPNSSGGASPCVAYRVTYEAKLPMNALTLELEGAPWNNTGTGPGTFAAITGTAIVQGVNPMIDPANATLATTGTVYYPFVRLNMTVFTPTGATGSVTARIYGYKGTSAAVPHTGGGGGGTIASTLDLLAGDNSGNAIDSLIPGFNSSITNEVVALGDGACNQNTGAEVICIGDGAAAQNSAPGSIAIGDGAGLDNSGAVLTAIGLQAGGENSGISLNAIGSGAGHSNAGYLVDAFGYGACNGNSGDYVICVGSDAATNNTFSNVIDITNEKIALGYFNWGPTQDNDAEIGDPSFEITHLYGNVSTYGGSLTAMTLPTPAAPTVTPTCAGGCTQTWGYEIVAVLADGTTTTATSAETQTSAQNATLDGTHSNLITCTEVPGASYYQVRRSTVATSPATTGIIGTLAYLSCSTGLVDNGLPGDNSPDPALNTTGNIYGNRVLIRGAEETLNVAGTEYDTEIHAHQSGIATQLVQIGAGVHSDDPNIQPIMYMNRSRGTETAKTQVQNGDGLGVMAFVGWDGTNLTYDISAFAPLCAVYGAPAAGSVPAQCQIAVSAIGSPFPAPIETWDWVNGDVISAPLTVTPLGGVGNAYIYADAAGLFHRSTGAIGTVTVASGSQDLSAAGAILSGACSAPLTNTATGVTPADSIIASFAGDPTGTVGFQPLVTGMLAVIPYPDAGGDLVDFKVCNNTALPITPGAIFVNWEVVR